jgi:hypothetical protein
VSASPILFRDAPRRELACAKGEVRGTMTEEKKSIALCQDVLATRVAQMIAARDGIIETEAIRKLMLTQTYDLLLDAESYLHLESAEYILYMYDAEQRGDWERWTEV